MLSVSQAMDTEQWVLADPKDGALIGLDTASGGYPWKPGSLSQVKIWPSREDAEHYAGTNRVFADVKDEGYKALRLYVVLEDPDDE